MFAKDFEDHLHFQTAQKSSVFLPCIWMQKWSQKGLPCKVHHCFSSRRESGSPAASPKMADFYRGLVWVQILNKPLQCCLLQLGQDQQSGDFKKTRFQVHFICPLLFEPSGFIFATFFLPNAQEWESWDLRALTRLYSQLLRKTIKKPQLFQKKLKIWHLCLQMTKWVSASSELCFSPVHSTN